MCGLFCGRQCSGKVESLNFNEWNFPMLLLRAIAILCAFSALGGCAFGQKIDYRQSSPYLSARSDMPVEVNVIDERPYVLDGDKDPDFVGRLRALYYNPFNVNTLTGDPLSFDIKEAVRSALKKSSIKAPAAYSTTSATPRQRLLMLTLREWKIDAYMRTRFDYDITASVLDEHGNELATKSAKNSGAVTNVIIAGTEVLSAVLNSDEIVAALSSEPKKIVPTTTLSPLAPSKAAPAYDKCMQRVGKISDPSLRISSMSMCDDIK
jgi:hypothetical protein